MTKIFSRYLGRITNRLAPNTIYPRGYLNISGRRFYWDKEDIGGGHPHRYRTQGFPLLDDLNLSTINASVANIVIILSTLHHMRYMDIPVRVCTLESKDAVVTMQNMMGYTFGHVYFDKTSAYIAQRSDRIVREQTASDATPNDYLTLLKNERDYFAGLGEHVTALRRCALVAAFTSDDSTLHELQVIFSNPAIRGRHLGKRIENVGRLLHSGLVPISEVIATRDEICLNILHHADTLKVIGIHNESRDLYRLVEKVQTLNWSYKLNWSNLLAITRRALTEKEERIRNSLRNTDSDELRHVSEILSRSTPSVRIPK